ncbi:MAG: MFS transporter [Clostridiales bacterium GWB2_37_7]|nr:MAG: MFS transporter [Clostridiales bacterium GWB2_37_7]
MYREMRRKDRQVTQEEALKILKKAEYGILATSDEQNLPYGVPLSYAYEDHCIYFHCAAIGQKLDNIKVNPKVSFCVVGDTKVIPEEFGTAFESVIVFGTAEIIHDNEEKAKGLRALVDKYSPDFKAAGEEYIKKDFALTSVVRINVEHYTGKQRDK